MEPIGYVIGTVAWGLIAAAVGLFAHRRGFSFWAYALFVIIGGGIIGTGTALITLHIASRRRA